ncbi:MAG TPA: ParB N-terminal domain-containing protein [Symbiobacteriaceae bacterium]|nr:ParB N-terminal domain-containing protein [Symbiobacteriaceae bacterium]
MPWFFPVRTVSSFDEECARLNLCEARDLGVMPIEVDKIIGSVGRWRDFDAKFRLINKATQQRYANILKKMKEGYNFPPIHAYKVGQHYYVADGNHRVAAAKALGVAYLDAMVQEYFPSSDDLEDAVYWRERSAFESATRCTSVKFSNPDSYSRLLSHLRIFQESEAKRLGYDLDLPSVTQIWLTDVDAPVRQLVRRDRLAERFEDRTEDDLVFYFIHHYVGMLRAAKGPENVTHRDAVARILAQPGKTMMGRFRKFLGELAGSVRDVIENIAELDL